MNENTSKEQTNPSQSLRPEHQPSQKPSENDLAEIMAAKEEQRRELWEAADAFIAYQGRATTPNGRGYART